MVGTGVDPTFSNHPWWLLATHTVHPPRRVNARACDRGVTLATPARDLRGFFTLSLLHKPAGQGLDPRIPFGVECDKPHTDTPVLVEA